MKRRSELLQSMEPWDATEIGMDLFWDLFEAFTKAGNPPPESHVELMRFMIWALSELMEIARDWDDEKRFAAADTVVFGAYHLGRLSKEE